MHFFIYNLQDFLKALIDLKTFHAILKCAREASQEKFTSSAQQRKPHRNQASIVRWHPILG